MIIRDIIEMVDELKPNAFSEKVKMMWILELDGKIAADVMLMSIADMRSIKSSYPEGLNHETLAEYPHDSMYVHWLEAKIDYANGEYNRYQNSMEMFNQSFDNFVCWFARTYEPAQGYWKENDCGQL